MQTFEELPPLDNVVAPPVKPKNGSNPRINVTLAPVDERTPRRLYTTPMEVTELVNNRAKNPIPPPKAAVETIGTEDSDLDPRSGDIIEPTKEDGSCSRRFQWSVQSRVGFLVISG